MILAYTESIVSYQLGLKMSDLRLSVMCRQFLAELKKAREVSSCVTAGGLAKQMGVSRTTAKKYLTVLVEHGKVLEYDFVHVNGQSATAYIPNRVNQR